MKTAIAIMVGVVICIALYFIFFNGKSSPVTPEAPVVSTTTTPTAPVTDKG